MPTFAYSLQSELLEPFQPLPEELLIALSGPLLETGDMKKSLQSLLVEGVSDRLPGLSHLLKQVRNTKESMLNQYDARAILTNLEEELQHYERPPQDGAGLLDRRGCTRDVDKAGGRRILDIRDSDVGTYGRLLLLVHGGADAAE